MYQLLMDPQANKTLFGQDLNTFAIFPLYDNKNRDYQAFLSWSAKGNVAPTVNLGAAK